jgi:transcription-repair coupling factor (superfamily II helicase)
VESVGIPSESEAADSQSTAELASGLLERRRAVRIAGLRGAARAVWVAQLARAHGDRPLLVIVPTAKAGDAFIADLACALGETPGAGRLRPFPRYDTQPYERFSPQPFVVAQRMDVLYRWLASAGARSEPAPVVVAPWTALAPRVPTRELVRGRTVHLELGQTIDRDALVATLVAAGYARMPLVEERGEIAVRGGILDVFPPHRAAPVRVELLGDEVESIREFDPASQRSQTSLGHLVAPPPRDLLPDRAFVIERSEALRALGSSSAYRRARSTSWSTRSCADTCRPAPRRSRRCSCPAPSRSSTFLPDDALVVIDDLEAGRQRMIRYAEESLENYELARGSGRLVCAPADVALPPEALERAALARRPVILEQIDLADPADGIERLAINTRGHAELRAALTRARADRHRTRPARAPDRRVAARALPDRALGGIALPRRAAARTARRLQGRRGGRDRAARVLALVGARDASRSAPRCSPKASRCPRTSSRSSPRRRSSGRAPNAAPR